jgi:hypothetical protein
MANAPFPIPLIKPDVPSRHSALVLIEIWRPLADLNRPPLDQRAPAPKSSKWGHRPMLIRHSRPSTRWLRKNDFAPPLRTRKPNPGQLRVGVPWR